MHICFQSQNFVHYVGKGDVPANKKNYVLMIPVIFNVMVCMQSDDSLQFSTTYEIRRLQQKNIISYIL